MSAKYFLSAQKLQNRSNAVKNFSSCPIVATMMKKCKAKVRCKTKYFLLTGCCNNRETVQSISFFPVVSNNDEIVQSPFLRKKKKK